jgi:hypothetical protein
MIKNEVWQIFHFSFLIFHFSFKSADAGAGIGGRNRRP